MTTLWLTMPSWGTLATPHGLGMRLAHLGGLVEARRVPPALCGAYLGEWARHAAALGGRGSRCLVDAQRRHLRKSTRAQNRYVATLVAARASSGRGSTHPFVAGHAVYQRRQHSMRAGDVRWRGMFAKNGAAPSRRCAAAMDGRRLNMGGRSERRTRAQALLVWSG